MTEKEQETLLNLKIALENELDIKISNNRIETILNIIEKQQKEIEKYRCLSEELQLRYNIEHQSKQDFYINKDLIIKKIDELEKELAKPKKGTFEYAMTYVQRLKFNIDILKELLEENE